MPAPMQAKRPAAPYFLGTGDEEFMRAFGLFTSRKRMRRMRVPSLTLPARKERTVASRRRMGEVADVPVAFVEHDLLPDRVGDPRRHARVRAAAAQRVG